MASVRVFLTTYRRPALLRRAVRSLLAQTHTQWVCEVHNDDPSDDQPRALLDELARGDSRFVYNQHPENWGAVGVFNHMYRGGPEPFASLLEDDNWWDPEFLQTAVAVLERNPGAAMAWANMRRWREEPDGAWTDLNCSIWTVGPGAPETVVFSWPECLQSFDALHSQGAMVFRPGRFRTPEVPLATPLDIIEPLRERAALGPLVLICRPLANFAQTARTARSVDPLDWIQSKLLVAASFFDSVEIGPAELKRLWAARRVLRPHDTMVFFSLALAVRQPRLLRHAHPADWLRAVLEIARQPVRVVRALRFRTDCAETWNWLVGQSAAFGRPRAKATALSKVIQAPPPPPP